MGKIIICYFSKTGSVKEMATILKNRLEENGMSVTMKRVSEINVEELIHYDCILVGSPTYYGSMAGEVKSFLDKTVNLHGELEGKIGGAFTSCAFWGGGHDLALMEINQVLLVHGMIIKGFCRECYFGVVSKGSPDENTKQKLYEYADGISELVKRLSQTKRSY
jgi:NAD(P)H dehydrogenase (quinone)